MFGTRKHRNMGRKPCKTLSNVQAKQREHYQTAQFSSQEPGTNSQKF